MHNAPVTFGEYLGQWIACKKMTVSELASTLGYKSKTSLTRVLHNRTGAKGNAHCLSALIASGCLSPGEQAAFEAALAISTAGVEESHARAMIWDLLYGMPRKAVALHGAVEDALSCLDSAVSAKVRIVNCCFPHLFARLRSLLEAHSAHTVHHDFFIGSLELQMAMALCSLSHVLHTPNYTGHVLRESHACTGIHLITFRARFADGTRKDALLLLDAQGAAQQFVLDAQHGLFDFLHSAIRSRTGVTSTVLVRAFASGSPADLAAVNRACLLNEQGRALFAIKPDLCINLIPPAHIRAALEDGGIHTFFAHKKELPAALEAFIAEQGQRFFHMFNDTEPKHIILSLSAMRAFARTGELFVRFSAMRPFTPDERIAIFENLLHHCEHNRFFNLYFWDEHSPFPTMEINSHLGRCVTLSNPAKDGIAIGGYSEVMINHPAFSSLVFRFFRDELKGRLTQENQSKALLRSLLEGLNIERGG